jgi:competence protein ComEA
MRIDANVASKADLRAVPGIGPAIAERIVADRQAEGPFGGIEEIQRVKGIGPKRLELIRPYLRVGPRGSP